MNITFTSSSLSCKYCTDFVIFFKLICQSYPIGHAKLWSEVRNHSYYMIFLGAEMEASVTCFRKTAFLSLPLRKQSVERNITHGQNSKISMHSQDVFIYFQDCGNTNRHGFLPYPAKPFGNFSLPKKYQHFIFNQARFQHAAIKHKQCLIT